MSNPFYIHADISWLRLALRSESRDAPGGYSVEAAVISLFLDVDRGRTKTLADYGRMWGWKSGTLSRRWPQLTEAVWGACSSGGAFPHSAHALRYRELIPPLSTKSFRPPGGRSMGEAPRKHAGSEKRRF